MPNHAHELPAAGDHDQDVFRLNYRALHAEESAAMRSVKLNAQALLNVMDVVRTELHVDPRCAALARTKLEEAVFWYTKAITGA